MNKAYALAIVIRHLTIAVAIAKGDDEFSVPHEILTELALAQELAEAVLKA